MRLLRRSAIAALALATALIPFAARAQLLNVPIVPPPTLISPMIQTGVPILFQWTPINPGNVYTFSIQARARTPLAQAAPLVVTYELQVSDRPDVGSHVLIDLNTSITIFSFQNQNVPGSGFTDQQTPGIALSGGQYYWRVRALLNQTPMPFSAIGRFALSLGNGGGSSTPLHDMQITSIVLTAAPYAGSTSAVVASIQNTGTYAENAIPLTITVNGTTIARLDVPPTTAGETRRLSALWTPGAPGQAQVTAIIDYPGQVSRGKIASISPYVGAAPSVQTSLRGTVALNERGYILNDTNGREVALIVLPQGIGIDLGAYLGRTVLVRGTMTKNASLLIITAKSVALPPPSSPRG
jgi:hypothetical protein